MGSPSPTLQVASTHTRVDGVCGCRSVEIASVESLSRDRSVEVSLSSSGLRPIMPRSNQNKFDEIFARHRPMLRAALRSLPRAPGPVDYDDIEQEVALRLWRAFEEGREIREMAAYLRTLVRSAVFDALRRARVRNETSHDPLEPGGQEKGAPREPRAIHPSPESDASAQQLSQALAQCLEGLNTSRRTAVKLHIQGFPNREISRLTGWSEGKTRNLTSRGLADLRQRLRERGWSYERA